jgi:hypothetical protein
MTSLPHSKGVCSVILVRWDRVAVECLADWAVVVAELAVVAVEEVAVEVVEVVD